eukprot:TRINITY_DN66967_c10_g1_i1.p1 TRINITY_DN66967_c10_g1~~TRINITY_DN66967_c10_g1_i1.p1  ORF type:complete len:806 (-),score=403.63 TRINITY_DN66967_c10_g1_i1:97-2514(-)
MRKSRAVSPSKTTRLRMEDGPALGRSPSVAGPSSVSRRSSGGTSKRRRRRSSRSSGRTSRQGGPRNGEVKAVENGDDSDEYDSDDDEDFDDDQGCCAGRGGGAMMQARLWFWIKIMVVVLGLLLALLQFMVVMRVDSVDGAEAAQHALQSKRVSHAEQKLSDEQLPTAYVSDDMNREDRDLLKTRIQGYRDEMENELGGPSAKQKSTANDDDEAEEDDADADDNSNDDNDADDEVLRSLTPRQVVQNAALRGSLDGKPDVDEDEGKTSDEVDSKLLQDALSAIMAPVDSAAARARRLSANNAKSIKRAVWDATKIEQHCCRKFKSNPAKSLYSSLAHSKMDTVSVPVGVLVYHLNKRQIKQTTRLGDANGQISFEQLTDELRGKDSMWNGGSLMGRVKSVFDFYHYFYEIFDKHIAVPPTIESLTALQDQMVRGALADIAIDTGDLASLHGPGGGELSTHDRLRLQFEEQRRKDGDALAAAAASVAAKQGEAEQTSAASVGSADDGDSAQETEENDDDDDADDDDDDDDAADDGFGEDLPSLFDYYRVRAQQRTGQMRGPDEAKLMQNNIARKKMMWVPGVRFLKRDPKTGRVTLDADKLKAASKEAPRKVKRIQHNADAMAVFHHWKKNNCYGHRWFFLMQDDFEQCPSPTVRMKMWYMLQWAAANWNDWSVLRSSYGLSGLLMKCTVFSDILMPRLQKDLRSSELQGGLDWTIDDHLLKGLVKGHYKTFRTSLFEHQGRNSTMGTNTREYDWSCDSELKTGGLPKGITFKTHICPEFNVSPCRPDSIDECFSLEAVRQCVGII